MTSPLVFLSRKTHISCAHRLHSPLLTDLENQNIYGQCNNLHGHGHNYIITVTLYGPVDSTTGMVINLTDLNKYMKECIVDVMDHKHLDLDVEYFKTKTSTVENITVFIWNCLKNVLPKPELLFEVKVDETNKNSAFYRGDLNCL